MAENDLHDEGPFEFAHGFDDPEEREDDAWEFDCGMDRHGNCGKAGSEECDWECPYRDVKRN